MKIGFFVPCYVDMLFPQAAISTYNLLKRLGDRVEYIDRLSCCGLPFADTGYLDKACGLEKMSLEAFLPYDKVVVVSGICTDQLRKETNEQDELPWEEKKELASRCVDVVEYLHDIKKVDSLPWAHFPHRVALHNGCHALRALREASDTELTQPYYSKTEDLLKLVDGIEVCYATRRDECCGFGGTFALWDAPCAWRQGTDKVLDYQRNGLEYVTSADCSCLMHQSVCAQKSGIPLKALYITEILNGDAK